MHLPPSEHIRKPCGWATPSGSQGQIPLDPGAPRSWWAGDIEAQIRRVFDNLKAIVVAAGATFDDVVKANVYLTDLSSTSRSSTKSWPSISASPTPHAPPSVWPAAAARCAGRSGVHRRLVIELKPVTALRGVGDTLAERLRALGVETTPRSARLSSAAAVRRPDSRGPLGRVASRSARGGGRRSTSLYRNLVSRPPTDAMQDCRWIRAF